MRAKRGPYKFTPTVAAAIVSYLKAGNFLEVAAAVAGVSKQTVYDWIKQGRRAGRGEMWIWAIEVEKAMSFAEVFMVAQIARAAKVQWQAAAWHLERKYPERWGRRQFLEHTGARGGPLETKDLTVPPAEMTTGEMRARLGELLAEFQAEKEAEATREDVAAAQEDREPADGA